MLRRRLPALLGRTLNQMQRRNMAAIIFSNNNSANRHTSQDTILASYKNRPNYTACCNKLHSSSVLLKKLVQFHLSDIGEGIAEVQIKEWHVKAGDVISQFDNVCEVQSDKASVTITSRYDGVVKKLYYEVDDIAAVGKPLIDVELDAYGEEEEVSSASSSDSKKETVPKTSPAVSTVTDVVPPSTSSRAKALATPAVRRIAMENNIVLTDVVGTGKDGRVLKEDILNHIEGDQSATERRYDAPVAALPTAEDRTVPIRGYTRIMMKTMAEANNIPHFGYRDEICVDRLVDLRSQLKSMGDEKGVRMSYMPLFIKAASMALIQYPVLNASLDQRQENLIYRAAHNICVAMDTPGGLVVPNIKHCEQKNLWEIAVDLNRLAEAGRKQQLKQEDLNDGTFTLSNIGTIGGTYAHPVIFPPQVAIGALGKIELLPRVFNFNAESGDYDIRPSNFVKVSWCADHRVIDGATMARFSNVWKRYLEHPALMIAEMR